MNLICKKVVSFGAFGGNSVNFYDHCFLNFGFPWIVLGGFVMDAGDLLSAFNGETVVCGECGRVKGHPGWPRYNK